MATSADALAAGIGTEKTDPDATEPTVEEVESQEEVDETAEPVEAEETEDDAEQEELPENIKEILNKNRKELREAKARATAAEKALAAKEKSSEEEAAPVDDKFKTLFINTAAKAALAEAGLSVGTDRFLRMLDLSSVEVDESGKISGLEDQIDDLKEEFKDLIVKPAKKPVTKVDGAGRRDVVEMPKSSAERLAARL